MSTLLNPDIKVVYRKTDEVFLRNNYTDILVSMSEGEYEVLSYYCEVKDKKETIKYFQEKYDFDDEFLDILIKKAEETEIVETENYRIKKEKKEAQHHSPFMFYIIGWLNRFSDFFGLRTTFLFKGNIRFFKVFTVDLKNTRLDNIAISKFGQTISLSTYWFLLILSVFMIFPLSTNKLSGDYIYNLSPPNVFEIVVLIILSILFSTFLHEWGHYLLYKRYGGETSEMGFALVLGLLPFIYVSTNSLYLWDKKSNRMIVTAAGIMVDILLATLILLAFFVVENRDLSFLLVFLLYYILIRIAFNLTPFIPATDGYFLLTDLVSNPSLFYDAGKASKKVWQGFKTFNFRNIETKEYIYTAYLLCSYFFITAYYSLMSVIILFPFFVRLFY